MANTNASINRFNEKAAAWDSNPAVVLSCELACKALLQHVPELRQGEKTCADYVTDIDAGEVGSGTGLLSFMLAPYVHTLICIDLAEAMVAAFNAKLVQPDAPKNVISMHFALDDPDFTEIHDAAERLFYDIDGEAAKAPYRLDLLVSHLTLHHLPTISDWLRAMYHGLKPGGKIALTDIENTGPDSVLFHPAGERGGIERHGIKRDEIAKLARDAGFVDVKVETAFSMPKEVNPKRRAERHRWNFRL
ncbi:S-adenosyl-L-methionine-dependent methyltransferase [Macrophomina phaseolina]|uniref:S-adenosyl-L-methionine-dependent methyltransferase n=1 Tax=Macrophomina phaseolina TaxID=35725 RepID=A0ABQ8FV50_9PEZI|nr:S-adenosyl-L-methionine-dependent methyltransferase [Macrophomina phaseolina]